MGGTSENDGKSVAARLSAAEAMRKKINAMLMAKGVLKKGDTPTASPTVSKEISINDSANRNVLMKKSIHVMIENQSKTKVIVKGTYVAPGSTPSPGVRPLYLLLTATSHEDVAKAEGIINKFISAGKQEKSVPKSSDGGLVIHSKAVKEKKKTPSFSTLSLPKNIGATSKVGVENAKTKKIPISLSISMCKLMEYPLLEKLSGPNNAYLDHINKTSGATVTIRGEGSSMSSSEKLHFHVSAINDSVLNSAVNLAGNLLETIYQDYRVKTGAGSVRTESAPPAPTSAPPSLPPGIIAHGGSQPQPPPHAPAAPAMNYGGYRAPYSNHHPHQPPPGYGSYPPPHGYNNSYYGYNNNNNQQQQQQYPGAYGGQPYYSSGGGPMPIPSMPPTSQYNPARPEYNPAAAASLPYSGPSVVGPEPNQKTAVNSDNSDEDDDGRDRNRSRDRRRDRDDRRRRSESPPRRKRFSEGPVKRKFEEDDESSDGDDSPKRKRSFREEPRKSDSGEKKFKFTSPPPPPPCLDTPPPPPPIHEEKVEPESLGQRVNNMDKDEWVSTGLGRLVNYGDSDSEQEDVEVVLLDKDGEKWRQKKPKKGARKSVSFLSHTVAYKALRASGKSIDESAEEALRELSPADRQRIPPITNTVKESGVKFWMQ